MLHSYRYSGSSPHPTFHINLDVRQTLFSARSLNLGRQIIVILFYNTTTSSMPSISHKPITAKLVAAPDATKLELSSYLYQQLFSDKPTEPYVAFEAPGIKWALYPASEDRSLPQYTCKADIRHVAGSLKKFMPVVLKRVNPVTIEHAIVTVPASQYETLNTPEQVLKALEPQLDKDRPVIRQGDVLLNGCRVRLCEPVNQGKVVKGTTKLTVAKEQETIQPADEAADVAFDIAEFLDFDTSVAKTRESTNLQVAPLEGAIPTPLSDRFDDCESRGFVKSETMSKLGVFSGDIVSIKTKNGAERVLRLFAYPEPNTVKYDVVYVSPILYHNIGDKEIEVTPNGETHKSVGEALDSVLEAAEEVKLARVLGPTTTDRTFQTAYHAGLQAYFKPVKRAVRVGDLIPIPFDSILARTIGEDPEMSHIPLEALAVKPDSVAWFQVTSLNGSEDPASKQYLVDSSQTKLIEGGTTSSAVIPTSVPWREYLGLDTLPKFGSEFAYADKIRNLVQISTSALSHAKLNTSVLLHSAKRGVGKSTVLRSVAAQCGISVFEISCFGLIGDNEAQTLGTLRAKLDRAYGCSPCVVVLQHLESIAKKSDQDGKDEGIVSKLVDVLADYSGHGVLLAATSNDPDKISEAIRSRFQFEIEIGVPSEPQRRQIFSHLTKSGPGGDSIRNAPISLRSDVSVENLALQSAGLTPPDLTAIVQTTRLRAIDRLNKLTKDSDTTLDDLLTLSHGTLQLTPSDFDDAIADARQKYSDSIGAPRIPNVGWDDVGGMEGVKKDILDTIETPLKYPHWFSDGVKKRSGILFYGPPGTGKTLLAKAIATTFSLNFFSVKGPELLNMYIGESEANVRRVFQKARDAKPCVVFFDELDSVAPQRGNQGDSGGVMDRIVSQLLAELDGMSTAGGEGVFVVGATNRPDLLDEALLRPGRFDKMLYLGISDTHEKQQTIMEALTRKFRLAADVSLEAISKRCPFTFTGADFYALCSDAMLNAMTRTANEVDAKIKLLNKNREEAGEEPVSIRWWFDHEATKSDIEVEVAQQDFEKAKDELSPSVSAEELQHYLKLRQQFEGGKK